jgi:hypothetical protein
MKKNGGLNKMKKIIGIVLAVLILFSVSAFAADQKGQITCTSTPTLVSYSTVYISADFQNQTPSTGIYIGPTSGITTSNAPFLLSSTTNTAATISGGQSAFWCVTANGSATLGYWIRQR